MDSMFGSHCDTCGSLVEACGDPIKCREDASLHIDRALRNRDDNVHPLLQAALDILDREFS